MRSVPGAGQRRARGMPGGPGDPAAGPRRCPEVGWPSPAWSWD